MKKIVLLSVLAIVMLANAKPHKRSSDVAVRGIESLVGGPVGAARQQQAENRRQAELNARRQQVEIERQRRENERAIQRQQRELERQETERERQRQLEFQRRQVEIERERADAARKRRQAEDDAGIGGISLNRWQVYLAAASVFIALVAFVRR